MSQHFSLTDFSSLGFAVFAIFTLFLYWILPSRHRRSLLLLCSYIFYASHEPRYILLLLGSTLFNFLVAIQIEENLSRKLGVRWLVSLCWLGNIGILFGFKYLGLFASLFVDYDVRQILLPLGVSFFTLQCIGYVLDVSRRQTVAERDFSKFALFVSFFPQIIAGPIGRAADLIPQLHGISHPANKFSDVEIRKAFYLFSYGYFKKFVVADNIAHVLSHFEVNPQTSLVIKHLTLIYFLIRIYCDFSGYSDMARGLALLFGVRLAVNFNLPLFAQSPSDFWERWHISLGAWIRRYFYLPLLLKVQNPYLSVFIVFPIMGLWHGANLNYLLWGLAWAALICGFKILNPAEGARKRKPSSLVSAAKAFGVFNCAALLMVFYKAENLEQLKSYFDLSFILAQSNSLGEDWHLLNVVAPPVLFVLAFEFLLFRRTSEANEDLYTSLAEKNWRYQALFYLLLIVMALLYSSPSKQPVFYMQY